MKTQLGTLFLIFALASGALAGVPPHFGESHCGTQEMMDMDCCQKAQQQELTPDDASAKLCCALNCSQNGSTLPAGDVRVAPPLSKNAPSHLAIASDLSPQALLILRLRYWHGPPGLPPVYLRTLSLLI